MEYIVFVHPDGSPTGEIGEKLASHHGDTQLHRAFSCYIFNDKNQLLVTQRAAVKKVWPTVWTNSVCGHPGPEETFEDAITRRSAYELGMKVRDITPILPKYTYTTPPYNGIIENEFCPVFFAKAVTEPTPNPEEVDAYNWLNWQTFVDKASHDTNDTWSWWCKDQVKQMTTLESIREWVN